MYRQLVQACSIEGKTIEAATDIYSMHYGNISWIRPSCIASHLILMSMILRLSLTQAKQKQRWYTGYPYTTRSLRLRVHSNGSQNRTEKKRKERSKQASVSQHE